MYHSYLPPCLHKEQLDEERYHNNETIGRQTTYKMREANASNDQHELAWKMEKNARKTRRIFTHIQLTLD